MGVPKNLKGVNYFVYPSLLNQFHNYKTEFGYGDEPLVDKQKLISYINRVPSPTTEAQQRGIDFESTLLSVYNGQLSITAVKEEWQELVIEMVKRLPNRLVAQQYVDFVYQDVYFYGFVDCVGGGRVIDIKTTSSYSAPGYFTSHQILYAYALEQKGLAQINSVEFLITDFRHVYTEQYFLSSYPVQDLLDEILDFRDFLNNNRDAIYDTKIFTGKKR